MSLAAELGKPFSTDLEKKGKKKNKCCIPSNTANSSINEIINEKKIIIERTPRESFQGFLSFHESSLSSSKISEKWKKWGLFFHCLLFVFFVVVVGLVSFFVCLFLFLLSLNLFLVVECMEFYCIQAALDEEEIKNGCQLMK